MEGDNCDICKVLVWDDDEALFCNICQRCSHGSFLSMTKQTFQKLKKSKDSKCKNIANNAPKKINSEGKKEYTNGDIMDALTEIKESYNKLMKKWEEQISTNQELKKELRYVKRKLNDKEQQELNNNTRNNF